MNMLSIVRGQKELVEKLLNDMAAMRVPYKYKGVEGNSLPIGVRPVQLIEWGFPKEHLEVMLRTLTYRQANNNNADKYPMKFEVLRKMLKLKKIPKIDYTRNIGHLKLPVYHKCVGIHHIGLKEDDIAEDGTELI